MKLFQIAAGAPKAYPPGMQVRVAVGSNKKDISPATIISGPHKATVQENSANREAWGDDLGYYHNVRLSNGAIVKAKNSMLNRLNAQVRANEDSDDDLPSFNHAKRHLHNVRHVKNIVDEHFPHEVHHHSIGEFGFGHVHHFHEGPNHLKIETKENHDKGYMEYKPAIQTHTGIEDGPIHTSHTWHPDLKHALTKTISEHNQKLDNVK